VLRHRRQSRRKRLLGPLGIGVVVFAAIGLIVAGNGASPPSTVGAVAGETNHPPAATGGARDSNHDSGPAAAAASVAPGSADSRPTPPVPEDSAGAEEYDAPLAEDLTGYRWPLAKPRLTLPFGPTPWGGWMVGGEKFHDGIDLATFCGDTVVAAHEGVVLAAGRHYDDQMGWIGDLSRYYARLDAKKLWVTLPIVVVVDDGNGYRSVYAHFGKVVVKKGQTVKAGELLGYEGRTGRASGCHLHYGLFSPLETDQFAIDPVAGKHMKLPGAEIARIDPQLVLPARTKPKPNPSASPAD
jgi:murein DD-endopeptidase MepM/ murein hydrolase activator NlpD